MSSGSLVRSLGAVLTATWLTGTWLAAAPQDQEVRDGSEAWPKDDILLVMLDDVGWDLLAEVETPNLDALVARSANYRNAWSYPSCSPARAALLTGRYGFRTGMGSVLHWGDKQEPTLALEEVTFAEALPERVDAFGKWHVSFGKRDPNLQGFEHYAGSLSNLNGTGRGYYDWRRTVDGKNERMSRYATTVTTDDALASDAPVRYVAYHAIHAPYESPPGGTGETPLARALEMLAHLDGELGRLLAEHEGYVFLISDNGTPQPLGGDKGFLVEGGLNVLFLAAGPGVEPGVRHDLVHVVDVLPTLLELRGLPPHACDGVSFVGTLRGEPGSRTSLYSEKFDRNGDLSTREWAMRDLTHKIIARRSPTPHFELFRMPAEVRVQPPFSEEDQAAIDRLRGAVPFRD